jgi:hypothetical protein
MALFQIFRVNQRLWREILRATNYWSCFACEEGRAALAAAAAVVKGAGGGAAQ